MYAEETVGFCSKASQVPHSMQRTWQFCQLCELCRFAKVLRKFAAHFCCALCRSGSALTTRHCQGHQPSPGWSAAHHLLHSISIRYSQQSKIVQTAVAHLCSIVPGSCTVARNARASPSVPPKKLSTWATQWRISTIKLRCDRKSWKETRICLAHSCRMLKSKIPTASLAVAQWRSDSSSRNDTARSAAACNSGPSIQPAARTEWSQGSPATYGGKKKCFPDESRVFDPDEFQDWLQIDPDFFQASLLWLSYSDGYNFRSPEVPEVKHPSSLIGRRCSYETAAYRGFSSPGGGCNAKRHHRLLGFFLREQSSSSLKVLQRPVSAAQGS